MKNNILFIIRESNIEDRVRLSKFLNYFISNNFEVELWKKKGDNDSYIEYDFHNICSNYTKKHIEYIIWNIRVFLKLLFRNDDSLCIATGFESALPIYLVSILKRKKYIFDNADNFYQSKNFLSFVKNILLNIERKIINRSIFTIIPDPTRAKGYGLEDDKFVILKNFPSEKDFLEAKKSSRIKTHKLVIYLNGWLVETRGLEMIESFLKLLGRDLDLKIKIAGKKNNLEEILKCKYVEYLGELSPVESLKNYFDSDLIFTFYDPNIEINKFATPNKWGDCLVTDTIPILNEEIETINDYFPMGGFYKVKYNDGVGLHKTVMDIYKFPEKLKKKKEKLKTNPRFFWDSQIEDILNLHNVNK